MLSTQMPNTINDTSLLLRGGEARNERSSASNAIVGQSARLKTVLQQVNRVAPTDTTVLILGETGTVRIIIADSQAIYRVGTDFLATNPT